MSLADKVVALSVIRSALRCGLSVLLLLVECPVNCAVEPKDRFLCDLRVPWERRGQRVVLSSPTTDMFYDEISPYR